MTPRPVAVPAIALAVALGASACLASTPRPQARGKPTVAASGTRPRAGPAPRRGCSRTLLAAMTLRQRVGQLFSIGLQDDRFGPEEVSAMHRYHFGSVWFTQTTTGGVQGVGAVARAARSLATRTAAGRAGPFVAANQEGGLIQALQGPGFSTIPSAADQGTLSPARLRADAQVWGRELRAAGINLDFAPVLDVVPAADVASNQPIGVLHRGFGDDPETVTVHGLAFMRGMAAAGVTTVIKHFPGLGRVQGNTDLTAGVVDDVTGPQAPWLEPFRRAVRAGAPMVMVALATYTRIDPQRPAVFSPTVMDLLRRTYGFDGVIVSDDLGAAAAVAAVPPADRATMFLGAGGDLIVSKYVQIAVEMAQAVLARARSDPGFAALVDRAALHVLRVKQRAGLLHCRDRA